MLLRAASICLEVIQLGSRACSPNLPKQIVFPLLALPYDSSGPIWQIIHSAAANAKHNSGLEKKKLIIKQIYVDEGPKLKRIRPRAQGRAYKILKPTCHITVVLTELN